jgi:hypothetical protein
VVNVTRSRQRSRDVRVVGVLVASVTSIAVVSTVAVTTWLLR